MHNCAYILNALSHVMQYLDQWPVAEWGPVDYSEICVMAPNVTQVCFFVLCLLQEMQYMHVWKKIRLLVTK